MAGRRILFSTRHEVGPFVALQPVGANRLRGRDRVLGSATGETEDEKLARFLIAEVRESLASARKGVETPNASQAVWPLVLEAKETLGAVIAAGQDVKHPVRIPEIEALQNELRYLEQVFGDVAG